MKSSYGRETQNYQSNRRISYHFYRNMVEKLYFVELLTFTNTRVLDFKQLNL